MVNPLQPAAETSVRPELPQAENENTQPETAPEQAPEWQNPFAGPGRGDEVVEADIQAVRDDPETPQELQDTIDLVRASGDETAPGRILPGLSAEDAAAASALYSAPEYAALPQDQQALAAGAFVDSGGDPAVAGDLHTLIRDPSFQAMNTEQQGAALNDAALRQTPEFRNLPPGDQRLVVEALDARKPGDTDLPASIRSLIESPQFQSSTDFSAAERTALLSQVRNYPDTRSVENLEALLSKQWFRDFNLGDTQRAVKTVAFLSQHDAGDQPIISNTLNLFVGENAPYRFDFSETRAYGSVPGNVDDLFKINPRFIGADNNPVDMSAVSVDRGEMRVIGHTFVHEVNHMRNWDKSLSLNSSYGFHEEYRAFYVGSHAQHGRQPTVADVIDRVAVFVNPNDGYDHLHALLAAGGKDAREIVQHLNTILGRNDLTLANARNEVNALAQAKRAAEARGEPLPEALSRPAGVTVGPPGTNNITNE